MNTPFEIGETYWAPIGSPEKMTIPCPVCFGQLAVTVVLGDGERVGVPCEACGKGFDGPQGTIEVWEHTPSARRFVIDRVKSMWDDRWTVESEDGQTRDFSELHETEAEAFAVAVEHVRMQHERNMRTYQRRRRDVANATWSIRYHREQIKDLERQIAWHTGRITAGPTTETKKT